MDTVIPEDVLDHLRELHAEQNDLEGWFRTPDLAEAMGCGVAKARQMLRHGMQTGQVICDRRAINEQQAHAMGLLGAGNTRLYRWRDE